MFFGQLFLGAVFVKRGRTAEGQAKINTAAGQYRESDEKTMTSLLLSLLADALGADRAVLLSAAGKVDPEISEYVAGDPGAADFLRRARDRGFADGDWDRLNQLAEIAGLGKEDEKK